MNALSTLYSELGEQLTKYAISFTREMHSAEDIVSETFLRATEHCIVKNNVPSRAWFYKVTRNTALDWLRKKGRLDCKEIPEIIDCSRGANPEESLEHTESITRLANMLAMLPENYKSVLILREYNDLTYAEIASVVGTSMDNVKVLLFRAKQKLRELYRRDD